MILLRFRFPLRLGVSYWDEKTEEKIRKRDRYLELFLFHFERLKLFRQIHPDRWPTETETFPKPLCRLGHWVSIIRRRAKVGTLLLHRVKLLRTLGFSWEGENERRWQRNVERVREVMIAFPDAWKKKVGPSLLKWFHINRRELEAGRLSDFRAAKIKELDGLHVPVDEWRTAYDHLVVFRKQHPNRWPSQKMEFPKGYALGRWCHRQIQASRMGLLAKERARLLHNLGLPLEGGLGIEHWLKRLHTLKAFRRKHPTRWPGKKECFPPRNPLGIWFHLQQGRFQKGKLEADKIRHLNRLGRDWHKPVLRTFDRSWQERYEKLAAFRHRYPDRWPRNIAGESPETERELADWCRQVRHEHNKGILSAERSHRLQQLGFPFDARLELWRLRQEEMKRWLHAHAGRWPSLKAADRKEKRMANWYYFQKRQKLPQECNQLLSQLGVRPRRNPVST